MTGLLVGRASRMGYLKVMSALVLVCAALALSVETMAQGVTYHYEYTDSLKEGTTISALKDGLFGDSISYVEGATQFAVTDVVAKTNVKLPLVFGRRWKPFATSYRAGIAGAQFELMGNWKPDIPMISGIYPDYEGFVTGSKPRCSGGTIAPSAVAQQGGPPVLAYNFWDGLEANIPGYGSSQLHILNPGVILPTDGKAYKFATLDGWRVSCLPELKNGVGEGYVVTLPDGATYTFDWVAMVEATPMPVPHLGHGRVMMYFLATKAQDRYGNTLTYNYDPDRPIRLQSIVASDGASITFAYNVDGRIASATSAGQTWNYTYVPEGPSGVSAAYGFLTKVTLPDSSEWTLERPAYAYGDTLEPTFGQYCNYDAGEYTSWGNSRVTRIRMTHPAGAVGEFYFKKIAHGYNNIPHASCSPGGQALILGRPKASLVTALIKKNLQGAGIPFTEWTFHYTPSWSFDFECTGGCPSTATTTVTRNDGRVEKHIYGNDQQNNANQLLSHRVLQHSTLLQRQDHRYLTSASGQPFPDVAAGPDGYDGGATLDNPFYRKNRPRYETTTYQDGLVMKQTINQFDEFMNELSITKESRPGLPPADPPPPPPPQPPNCPGCAEP